MLKITKWWPEAVNQRTKHLHSPLAQYIPSIIFTMYFYPWLLDTFYCKVATHKKITKYCYNTYVFKIATIHLCSRLLQYICVQDCYNTFVFRITTIHLCSRLLQHICVQDCYNTFVFKIATIHLCSRLLQYICVQDCYNTYVFKIATKLWCKDCQKAYPYRIAK